MELPVIVDQRQPGPRNARPVTLNRNAISAPNVTISPWAKLVRPVVPKISDSPTEHMAMISPSRMPSAKRCAHLSKVDSGAARLVPVK